MIKLLLSAAALTFAFPVTAQEVEPAPSPNQIVEAASADEWVSIPADDLLVMTLTPDPNGNAREVVVQLMPAPFSQGWVENIRTLARAQWYDGVSVNRVQDNYVVQWGDATEAKPLPAGLNEMGEGDYRASDLLLIPDPRGWPRLNYTLGAMMIRNANIAKYGSIEASPFYEAAMRAVKSGDFEPPEIEPLELGDRYAPFVSFASGWPIAGVMNSSENNDIATTNNGFWPIHCYGMVGVGRDYSPDTGSGAELYTVIGHAPRHLDRNIALVGRVVEGMEHLSSLPRGSGELGFYTDEEADKRTPILSVRLANDLPENERPAFEYLSTDGEAFARYAEARANRRDPFFITPAGGADICNIPAPVRRAANGE